MLYTSPWWWFELTASVVKGTNCIGSSGLLLWLASNTAIQLFPDEFDRNTLLEHLSSPPLFSGIRVVFCRSLFVLFLLAMSWWWFELTASVVKGTNCIGSCKSNYHTITTTPTDLLSKYKILFVSDLRQVGGFLWVLQFPPPIKLTPTI
jgi:hypothetical protein